MMQSKLFTDWKQVHPLMYIKALEADLDARIVITHTHKICVTYDDDYAITESLEILYLTCNQMKNSLTADGWILAGHSELCNSKSSIQNAKDEIDAVICKMENLKEFI